MKVEQISIFLENKPGGLEKVTRILRDVNINIRTLAVADTSDFGIVRMIVNNVEAATKVLKENGFTVSRTTVVAVEVPDRPGGLHSILEAIAKENVNIAYMYAFVEKSGENAVMLFRFDQQDKAIEVLVKNGINVLPGEKLYAF
ncbi:MAG: amino acid-binding protein [Syntrophus sp. (in: bacteria)]|nr:amino acid-binding protein [Syntrophus sp. (in: bacteria)]